MLIMCQILGIESETLAAVGGVLRELEGLLDRRHSTNKKAPGKPSPASEEVMHK
jgi:hypothetical protein